MHFPNKLKIVQLLNKLEDICYNSFQEFSSFVMDLKENCSNNQEGNKKPSLKKEIKNIVEKKWIKF